MISKTRQLERFKELIEAKSFHKKCLLRLDHETVNYYNNGKRTVAEIAEDTRIPLKSVSIFMTVPVKVWDSIMTEKQYCDWTGREFDYEDEKKRPKNGITLKEARIDRIGKIHFVAQRVTSPKLLKTH